MGKRSKYLPPKPSPEQITRPIPPCKKGRRLVIGDIHGCHLTFAALLEKIQLTPNDQLFLLGDYISRGPSSGKVIDRILDLQADGFQVYCLRGNHEQMVLDTMHMRPFALPGILKRLEARDLLNKHGNIRQRYLNFLNGLYWYFELENHFLVHAGFNFHTSKPFADLSAMLNIRNFHYDVEQAGGKGIIHGHKRTSIKVIKSLLRHHSRIQPLDNGCCNTRNIEGQGKLLCFDLTNHELYGQKNIDFKVKKGRLQMRLAG